MAVALVKVKLVGRKRKKYAQPKTPKAVKQMRCVECDLMTTKAAAEARQGFANRISCSRCGGALRRVPAASPISQEKVIKARRL